MNKFIVFFLLSLAAFDSSWAATKNKEKKDETAESRLMSDINKLFNERMPEMFGAFSSMSSFRMNMMETPDTYHIDAELPGVKKADIAVNLKGDMLIISGEKKSYFEEKKDQYTRVERSNGSFSRAITLPPDADKNKITTKLEDGLLKIDIGKLKDSAPKFDKKIEIL